MLSIWRPGARTRRYRRWRKRSRARPVTTLYSDPRHSLRSHVILGLDTGHGTQWSSSIVRHRWEQNREVISQYIRFPVLVTHLPCSGAPFPRGWGAWVRFPGVGGRPPPATYLQSALMYFHGILAVDLLGGKVMHYNLESHQSKPILFAGDVPKIACTFPSLAVWLLATTSCVDPGLPGIYGHPPSVLGSWPRARDRPHHWPRVPGVLGWPPALQLPLDPQVRHREPGICQLPSWCSIFSYF